MGTRLGCLRLIQRLFKIYRTDTRLVGDLGRQRQQCLPLNPPNLNPKPYPPYPCQVPDVSVEAAQKNYKKSVEKGILKIMSKMGISLLQCYHGAQIFEAYGLGRDVVELCFKWVPPALTLSPSLPY